MRSQTVLKRPSRHTHLFGPTKLISIEFTEDVWDLSGLETYAQVAVLVRYYGSPLGCVLVPCVGGKLKNSELRKAILQHQETSSMLAYAALNRRLKKVNPIPSPKLTWSIIVCTRDRVHHLKPCLDALSRMHTAEGEIVIVDNDPPDSATRDLVAKYPQMKYVVQPRRGLNAARSAGAEAATGEILLYTDDDVLIDPNWVDKMLEPFAHPRVGAAAGLVMPYELETPAQALFEYYGGHGRGYRRKVFDFNNGGPAVNAGKIGSGANMAFRRSLVVELDLFEPELDMGTVTLTGGDTHAFYIVLAKGYQVVYTPDALVWHVHRRNYESLKSLLYSYSLGGMAHLTRCWMRYRDAGVWKVAWSWLKVGHLKPLYRALRKRKNTLPLDLILPQLAGFFAGPRAYLKAKLIEDARQVGRLKKKEFVSKTDPQPKDQRTEEQGGHLCSVIIPSYNRRNLLERVLVGLENQTMDMNRVEVIVVLDGSTDDSQNMLADWQKTSRLPHLRWFRQEHSGQSAARTRGAKEALAPVLLFLDDDVVPDPGLVMAHLNRHQLGESIAVLGDYNIVREKENSFYQTLVWAWWEDILYNRKIPGRPVSYRDFFAGNVSLKTSDFIKSGGFDAEFKGYGGEDYELGYRLLQLGIRFVSEQAASALHYHRVSLRHVLRNTRQEGRNDVLFGKKHPELRRGLRLMNSSRGIKKVFFAPRVFAALEWGSLGILTIYEHLGFRESWIRIFRRLRHYAYWRGVQEVLGTWETLLDYQAESPKPNFFDWDLACIDAGDLNVPADSASEGVVRYHGRIIGNLKLKPPISKSLSDYLTDEMFRQLPRSLHCAMIAEEISGFKCDG
jgi:glycosyltransferase involved in cell wall biosynthesis